ncbi:MAG: hypothetical protein ACRDTS_00885 [Mycobacterium sp.]
MRLPAAATLGALLGRLVVGLLTHLTNRRLSLLKPLLKYQILSTFAVEHMATPIS